MQASDFLGYILDNKDLFLEEQLKHVQSKEEEQKVVMAMLVQFMLELQNCLDTDKAIRILIENSV